MPPSRKAIRLHKGARIDLSQSVTYYRRNGGERWALAFKQKVEDAFRTIAADPGKFSSLPKYPRVKKVRLEKFPFFILFIEGLEFIWVIAVAHPKRQPEYWLKRLP